MKPSTADWIINQFPRATWVRTETADRLNPHSDETIIAAVTRLRSRTASVSVSASAIEAECRKINLAQSKPPAAIKAAQERAYWKDQRDICERHHSQMRADLLAADPKTVEAAVVRVRSAVGGLASLEINASSRIESWPRMTTGLVWAALQETTPAQPEPAGAEEWEPLF